MDLGQVFAAALGLGSVMGWVVGWIQGSALPKAKVKVLQSRLQSLEQDLKWAKATESAAKLDLERAREKLSDLSMALDSARSKQMGQDHK